MSKLREAVKLVQLALPNLPVGTEPHKAAIDAVKSLSKAVPATEEIPGVQRTQLMSLIQQAQQNPMIQQLQRTMGGPPPAAAA